MITAPPAQIHVTSGLTNTRNDAEPFSLVDARTT